MKKIAFLSLLTLFFVFIKNVQAGPVRNIIKNEIKPTIKAIKEEVKPTIKAIKEEEKEELKEVKTLEERKEVKKEIREKNKRLLDQIKNQIKEKLQNLRFSARITGKITEKGENTIKVETKDAKVYQVNITEKTQLRRRFWGKSNLNEFTFGDEVNVIGRYTNEEKTIIDAVLIRDLSIQRRWGVFFGEVIKKNSDNFVIKTIERGEQTVYFGNAVFNNYKKEKVSYSDLQIGSRVRVKGVWDRSLNQIIEVEEVRVFPQKPTPTITQ